jgi:hypothetical protein
METPDHLQTTITSTGRLRDIYDDDGQPLFSNVLSTLPGSPALPDASFDGTRGEVSAGRGVDDGLSSICPASTTSACQRVGTRSAAVRAVPAVQPSQLEMELTPHMFAERAAAMFAADASWPVSSGMEPIATQITKRLVLFANSITAAWSRQYVNDRSRAYGNFDRAVGLGWLIGDALGHPLLGHAEAFTIGPEARRKAAVIKQEVADARRAVQRDKAKFESDDAREAAKDAAERAKLAEPLELPLVFQGTGPSESSRSGRKRRRSVSTGMDYSGLLPTVHAARAAYEAAAKAADEAEAHVDVCEKRVERQKSKLEALGRLPAGVGAHIQPDPPCDRCRTRYRKRGRKGDLWHCKECKEKVQRAMDAEEQRDQKLGGPWRRAQAKVDAAEAELRELRDAMEHALHAQRDAREDLYRATERDLRDKIWCLRGENTYLRAEVERLSAGGPQLGQRA